MGLGRADDAVLGFRCVNATEPVLLFTPIGEKYPAAVCIGYFDDKCSDEVKGLNGGDFFKRRGLCLHHKGGEQNGQQECEDVLTHGVLFVDVCKKVQRYVKVTFKCYA